MLAIFMVRLYGMRVHVLENNAGLLQRDFKQNAPFYARFDIKCGTNLDEEDTQIVYCLKDAINRRFLRRLVAGKLDEELGKTVLIVDEARRSDQIRSDQIRSDQTVLIVDEARRLDQIRSDQIRRCSS